MKRGTVVQGRLLTEAHELAEAKELRRRIAWVSRPSEDDWKVMRRLKQLLEVHTPGDWPFLLRLTEAVIARAEHARIVQAKDLKVGDKVWYVLCPGELPLAGEVQRITECYHVVVRLLDSHPAGNKAVTISPSSALTSEAEVTECRRQAAAYWARIEAITPPDVTDSVSRTADAAGERGETMSWECLGPGEYASADRLWTILHVARGWSVASAALQVE